MVAVFLLFFFSGFAALIYELLWFRQLGFIFGNTVHAATAVVTAYMLGLALGARLVGRWTARIKNPVRCFALFELGIGICALAMPLLFSVVREAYRLAYLQGSEHLPMLTALRFALALAALLVPTMLMGGTLPLLTEGLVRRDAGFGRTLSRLYGVNTLGAVTGIATAGFVLMPALGMRCSSWVGVASNVLVAAGGLLLSGRTAAAAGGAAPVVAAVVPRRHLLLAGLSGFVALALEIVWFRALVLVFGSTTYSFTAMLAVFLFGIGAGSLVLSRMATRVKDHAAWFAAFQIAIGLATALALYTFPRQPEFLLSQFINHGLSWRVMTVSQVIITLKCLLLPTLLMGMSFPLLVIWYRTHDERAGLSVGRIYAANTMGCVLGSLSGGFLLLPWLGIERSLVVLTAVSLAVGLGAMIAGTSRIRMLAGAAAAGLVIALFIFSPPAWNPQLLSAGPHFSPWQYIRNGKSVLKEKLKDEELVFYREGITATVGVSKLLDQSISYTSGGKVEADSSPRSMMLQRLAGHLPMLVHPDPKSVVNIGLGAGVSFGALGCYPLEHLEVVEIEPAAVNVADVFGPYNHHITKRRDIIITINDGRNLLFCSTNTYDVITSDPFEPVHAGANHLYTQDHFRQARTRLRPGGIMSQYVPLYELAPAEYLAIVRSFVSVFPQTVLFYTGEDTLLLGFRDQINLDPQTVRRRFEIPAARASLGELGFTKPETLLGMFVADLSKNSGFVGTGELNTDDHPVVEYAAPKSALSYTTFETCKVLFDNFTALPPQFLAGLDDVSRQALEGEHAALKIALQANIERSQNNVDRTFEYLMKAYQMASNNPVIRNELISVILPSAENLRQTGQLQMAAEQYQMVLALRQREFWALFHMIPLALQGGNPEYARATLQHALEFYPSSPLMWMQKAKFDFSTGQMQAAGEAITKATDLGANKPDIWDEAARLYKAMNRPNDAQFAAQRADTLRRASPF